MHKKHAHTGTPKSTLKSGHTSRPTEIDDRTSRMQYISLVSGHFYSSYIADCMCMYCNAMSVWLDKKRERSFFLKLCTDVRSTFATAVMQVSWTETRVILMCLAGPP